MFGPKNRELPPLPFSTRAKLGRSKPHAQERRFRGALCGAALISLLLGIGFLLDGVLGGSAPSLVIGVVGTGLFAVSAVASRGWSDDSVHGPRRVAAESPFLAIGLLLVGALGFAFFYLALILIWFFSAYLVPIPFLFAVLLLGAWFTRGLILDLGWRSIARFLPLGGVKDT